MWRCLVCGLLAVPPAAQAADDERPPTDRRPWLVLDTGGHTSIFLRACFTRDGKRLVTSSRDKTVQVWDVESGQRLSVVRPPTGPGELGSPIGLAVDGVGRNLAFWAAEGDSERPVYLTYLCSLQSGQGRSLAGARGALTFSPDGTGLAVGFVRVVRLFDVATGKQRFRVELPKVAKPRAQMDLAYSSDGAALAAVAEDNQVYLLDAATFALRKTLSLADADARLVQVGWVDGKTLLARDTSAQTHNFHVWSADREEPRKSWAFRQIASKLPRDNYKAMVTAQPLRDTSKVFLVIRAPVGGAHARRAGLFDWMTGEWLSSLELTETDYCQAATVSPDGTIGALGSASTNEVVLFDTSNGKELRRLRAPARGAATNVVFSPNGKAVAWAPMDAQGTATETRTLPLQYELDLTTLALRERTSSGFKSYEPRRLGRRGPLTAKKTDSWTVQVTGGSEPASCTIKPNTSQIQSWSLAADQRVVITTYRNTVRVFDATNGKELHEVRVCRAITRSLAMSPDGRVALIGSADQTLVLFNPVTAKVLLTVYPAGRDWVAWTPEGYYAASGDGERLMGWTMSAGARDLATFYPASRFRGSLYRPDVIQRLLVEGSTEKALEAADKARGAEKSAAVDVGEVLPPQVTLTAPGLESSVVSRPTLEIEATAEGRGKYPVVALQLLLDGRPYGGADGLKRIDAAGPGESVKQRWTVELPPGEHALRALARSRASSALSDDLEVTYTERVAAPRLFVLAIGIDNYRSGLPRLRCAVNDARELRRALEQHANRVFDFRSEQARLLANATQKEVRDGLKWLHEQKLKPQDVAVIFAAGHGEKDAKGMFYFLPQDVDVANLARTAISAVEIQRALKSLGGKVLLLLDTCHSGAIGRSISDLARTLGDDDCGVVLLCASRGAEKAGEDTALEHGYFCLAVLEGLAGKGGKSPRDGIVYTHHLERYVIDRVLELSKNEQHPTRAVPAIGSFPVARP